MSNLVRLPIVPDGKEIADNKSNVIAQFKHLESKLTSPVCTFYVNFMTEYEKLSLMSMTLERNVIRYFIPHHAILRPSSTTTKLKVVFNASSKTATGNSLNNLMLKGPTIQKELFDIHLTFLTYTFAFTADITKMY